jgi:hypothetical protein
MERLRKNKKSGSDFSDVFGLIFLFTCCQDQRTLSTLHQPNGIPQRLTDAEGRVAATPYPA